MTGRRTLAIALAAALAACSGKHDPSAADNAATADLDATAAAAVADVDAATAAAGNRFDTAADNEIDAAGNGL